VEEEANAYKRMHQTRGYQQWEGRNQAGGPSLPSDESSVFVLDPYWMLILLATLVFVVRTCAVNRKERDAIYRRKSSLKIKNGEAGEDHSESGYSGYRNSLLSESGHRSFSSNSNCISRENSEVSFQELLSNSAIAMAELDESAISPAEMVIFRSPSPAPHLLSKRRKQ